MKKINLLVLAVLAILSFTSCEKYSDKKFSTTIPLRIEVDAQTLSTEGFEIDLSKVAEVLSLNENLNAVKDQIKYYELVRINYKVYEYWNSPTNIFNGTLGFGDGSMSTPGVSKAMDNFVLQESMDATEQSTFAFTSDEINTIQKYFLDTNSLKVFYKGDLTEAPATFTLYLQIDIDAVAEVEK